MSEFDEFDDFDFSLPTTHGARQAYRALVQGVAAVVPSHGLYAVRDISALGLALLAPCDAFVDGEHFRLDLFVDGEPYIEGLLAHVVRRCDAGLVACSFDGPNRAQEEHLDKLVLEVQKRQIAERKAAEQRNEESKETTRDIGADERS
ncbi:PilZ domain-containing protein [Nitratidesulfovibrio vulgaris]|jgi:hypothetical protein|uniref:PilZ domain-containing protein n=2 Tax=Nitratidesulfovibrio vulgaris TaxID=881 RepID=Q729X0_NITV2|nr:PilZ domain-containing protein [Nitratidesulfovibrio vulgaris]GEB80614.1 pilus assembly protein PilZ [Desulfovibrio desulfuricans]HBW16670.1 PilZ domain-containing protein [Desulfovibrio sp.]AAS96700.1 hypothetical protein DVU_2227 [Nitratidesulfovibrio vulgaris str. Hildenborough]ABM28034.1 type IV pilus assembly PilZ [Nitratidesulfovibrio vulgaris DP4]ADP87217.1 type IV pilus assembly PilZ [Nitratidesulfovibrio vulgaris RCH1]